MSLDRRTVLKGSLAPAAVTGGPFAGFVNAPAGAVRKRACGPTSSCRSRTVVTGWSAWRCLAGSPTDHSTTPRPGRAGRRDDASGPARRDGAIRRPRNSVFLVRNHEVNGSPGAFRPEIAPRYNAAAGGGTTTIQVTRQGKVLDSWTSLSGTMMNCSGGIMPWGSWITCEETINGPDVGHDFTRRVEHHPGEAARLHLRRARSTRQAGDGRADHRGRSIRPRSGLLRPGRAGTAPTTSSPGRRSARTARLCTSTSRLPTGCPSRSGALGELRLLRRLSRSPGAVPPRRLLHEPRPWHKTGHELHLKSWNRAVRDQSGFPAE